MSKMRLDCTNPCNRTKRLRIWFSFQCFLYFQLTLYSSCTRTWSRTFNVRSSSECTEWRPQQARRIASMRLSCESTASVRVSLLCFGVSSCLGGSLLISVLFWVGGASWGNFVSFFVTDSSDILFCPCNSFLRGGIKSAMIDGKLSKHRKWISLVMTEWLFWDKLNSHFKMSYFEDVVIIFR